MECVLMTVLLSFLGVYLGLRYWIKMARQRGLVGKDMNKVGKFLVPEAGGVIVVLTLSTLLPLLSLCGVDLTLLLALSLSLLLSGFIGFIDDILGWKKGFPQWMKVVLSVLPAVPLSLYTYFSHLSLLGFDPLITSLFLVPLAVVGVSNAVNILAGYNGLEAGLSFLIIFFLSLKSFLSGSLTIPVISSVVLASIAAFLLFNWYPARVFPGDVFTYSIGTLFAGLVILSGEVFYALWLFIPYFIDAVLRIPVRFKVETFGVPQPDGTLKPRYKKPYNLPQLLLFLLPHPTERKVVLSILLMEVLFGVLGLLLF